MADGSSVPIEGVRVGMTVQTKNGKGTVADTFCHYHEGGLIQLKAWGLPPLACTPEHRILTSNGMLAARDLSCGDAVVCPRPLPGDQNTVDLTEVITCPKGFILGHHAKRPGRRAVGLPGEIVRRVRSVEAIPFSGLVYNFQVEPEHSYIAGCIAVSNCVGFGCAGFIATAEAACGGDSAVTDADGDRIYYEAKVIDGEPNQEDGSTVRSGAQALQKNEKVVSAYAFGTFAQAKQWVSTKGPVVIGIDWTVGMEDTDSQGVIHAVGSVAGGHCILWHGTDIAINGVMYNVLRNSWGDSWGIKGDCYISDSDLEKLIDKTGGEAMMAVKPASPTPNPAPTPTPTPTPTTVSIPIVGLQKIRADLGHSIVKKAVKQADIALISGWLS
jgi:hypothetical protein